MEHLTFEMLKQTADELNALLFDPDRKEDGWVHTDVALEELSRLIVKASELLYPDDKVSDTTTEVIEGLKAMAQSVPALEKKDTPPEELFKKIEEAPLLDDLYYLAESETVFADKEEDLTRVTRKAMLRDMMLDIVEPLLPLKKEETDSKEAEPETTQPEKSEQEVIEEPPKKGAPKKEPKPKKEPPESKPKKETKPSPKEKVKESPKTKVIEEPKKEKKDDKLIVKDVFLDACPALSEDEFARLKALIKKDGRIINPIITWNDFIIDGHNRYRIARELNMPFDIQEKEFASEADAVIWIKENAISQRNLSEYTKFELMHDIELILAAMGKERMAVKGEGEPINVRKVLAEKSGLSEGTIARAKVVERVADEDTIQRLRDGDTTIGAEYKKIKTGSKKKADAVALELTQLNKCKKELKRWAVIFSDYGDRENIVDLMFPVMEALEEAITNFKKRPRPSRSNK